MLASVPRRVLPAVLLAAAALPVPAAAADGPVVHAHRGGSLAFGVPVAPENTPPAFAAVADRYPGTWLELDSVVSADGVPFVIHDSTLDRTTDCAGPVVAHTAAEIEACRVDLLGTAATTAPAPSEPVVRVPRLADVLALARERGLGVNVEIKRIPGDPGYVPGDESFAIAVLDVLRAAGIPRERMIVQSFDPTNLETARRVLPEAQRSFLTLAGLDAGGLALAAAAGHDWISPSGVPSASLVRAAHDAGLRVVPYTLNTEAQVRAAAAAGVDALITDDPPLALRALGRPTAGPPAAVPAPRVRRAARLSLPSRTRRQVLVRGGLPAVLTAHRPARATVTLRRGRVLVARGVVALRGAGTRRVLLRLTPAGRRAVRRATGSLRLTARVTVDGRARRPAAVVLRRD